MRISFRLSSSRTDSVSQSWRSPLPQEKSILYLHTLRMLETSYTIFSIILDEAIGFRRGGQLGKAYQALSLAPTLCKRLSWHLEVVLRAMHSYTKHFRTTPSISPLDLENFQSAKSRRAAAFNELCSRIVLSQRSQFLHKLSTLADLTVELADTFRDAATKLKDSSTLQPDQEWAKLDSAHYDINTCLQESIVMLKCFLHTLPAEQVDGFSAVLQDQPIPSFSAVLVPKRHLAHRRMALLKGQ